MAYAPAQAPECPPDHDADISRLVGPSSLKSHSPTNAPSQRAASSKTRGGRYFAKHLLDEVCRHRRIRVVRPVPELHDFRIAAHCEQLRGIARHQRVEDEACRKESRHLREITEPRDRLRARRGAGF